MQEMANRGFGRSLGMPHVSPPGLVRTRAEKYGDRSQTWQLTHQVRGVWESAPSPLVAPCGYEFPLGTQWCTSHWDVGHVRSAASEVTWLQTGCQDAPA